MPIVEKKDALMDAINVAASARAWLERSKKAKLIKAVKHLSRELDSKTSWKATPKIFAAEVLDDDEGEEPGTRGSKAKPAMPTTALSSVGNPSIADDTNGGSAMSILSRFSFGEGEGEKIRAARGWSFEQAWKQLSKYFRDVVLGSSNWTANNTSKMFVHCSLWAFAAKEHWLFTLFRHSLTALCYIDSYVVCNRVWAESTYGSGNDFDGPFIYQQDFMYTLDLMTNIGFVALGLVRFLIFPLYLAFGDYDSVKDLITWVFRKSGLFDIAIGMACIFLSFNDDSTGGISDSGQVLRLIRMMVISIILVDSVDSLDVLLSGIFNGVRAIRYTLAVMFILIVAFGFFCHLVLGDNDPYHFGGFGHSMLTLLEVMTLDSWREVMDINYGNCQHTKYETVYSIYTPLVDCDGDTDCIKSLLTYPGYLGQTFKKSTKSSYGDFMLPYCDKKLDDTGILVVWIVMIFIFIIVTAFILWNLNTAAVTTGISERLYELKEQSRAAGIDMDGQQVSGESSRTHYTMDSMKNQSYASSLSSRRMAGEKEREKRGLVDMTRLRILLRNAWNQQSSEMIVPHSRSEHMSCNGFTVADQYKPFLEKSLHYWLVWSNYTAAPIVHHRMYVSLLDFLTIVQGVVTVVFVGVSHLHLLPLWVDLVFQLLFTIDVILTAMAAYPSMLSYKSWDVSDLVVTLAGWPLVSPALRTYDGDVGTVEIVVSFLYMLRVLKCLRILDQFPSVKIIFRSLMSSAVAFVWVFGLVILTMVHFAMIGSYLFRANDPAHFENFMQSFITMFQVATLDAWGEIARLNMIGCDYAGVFLEIDDSQCTCGNMSPLNEDGSRDRENCGQGVLAALFFVVYIIVVVMILFNLLIAIIIASMEMLKESMIHEKFMWEKVNRKSEEYNLSRAYVHDLLKLFDMLDIELNGKLSLREINPILELVSGSQETQLRIFHEVDRDGSGAVDFAEFCELVHLLKLAHEFIKNTPSDGTSTSTKMSALLKRSTADDELDQRKLKMSKKGITTLLTRDDDAEYADEDGSGALELTDKNISAFERGKNEKEQERKYIVSRQLD